MASSLRRMYDCRLDPVLVWSYLFIYFSIWIQFVSGQYRLTPKNTIGVEGQSATMQCAISSVTGVVVWNHIISGKPTLQLSIGGRIDLTIGLDKKKRIAVVGNRGRGEYHLRIKNVKMSDAGRYECMALVGLTRIVKRSAALRVVRAPNPGYPICRMEPAFRLQPGMEVVLLCETMGGIPLATVRWHDGTKALTPNTEGQVTYTRTLTAADYGIKFTCQEITPAYRTPRTCVVTPLEIDLKIVDLQPSPRVEVRPGKSVSFSCFGQGTNAFTYSWELNDRPLLLSRNTIVSGTNKNKLEIVGITAASNNAKISCVLRNSYGFTTRSSSVISVMSRFDPKPPEPSPRTNPDVGVAASDSTFTQNDYDVHFNSEIEGQDWGMDPPGGGGTSTMSSPAMTAIAALLVGVFFGLLVAVGVILTRKYLKHRDDSTIGFVNRTHSTSIPSSSLDDQGSSVIFSDGNREYDLPPRDYPRSGQPEGGLSYLGLRPESLTSTKTTYQGLHQTRPRLSTYNPSCYSSAYEGNNVEYYEDVLNNQDHEDAEQRESIYHYRFSPPVDERDFHPRCMSADRATRHFTPQC